MTATKNSVSAKLSEEQKQQFIRDGYVVVSGLIPQETVQRTRAAILGAHGMSLDDPETWKRDQNVLFDDYGLTLDCQTPALYDAAADITGADIRRGEIFSPYREKQGQDPWMSGFIPVLVYPTPGEKTFDKPSGYHIDGMHKTTLWPKFQYLVIFAYLTDVPEYAGATALWPGGHRQMFEYWHSRVTPEHDAIPDYTAELPLGAPVPFTGKAGDVVFMHYLLPHSGTANHGNIIRVGLNSAVSPDPDRPYQIKEGSPDDTWTPMDWTVRTDNLTG